MKRRDFIALLGGAAAWPLAARAQQHTVPVIGFLNGQSPDQLPHLVAAFRQGLGDVGYVEGQNVAIEYRWAEGQEDRLPALAADLVRRPVAVIAATGGTTASVAAKAAASSTIAVVFLSGDDPVRLGLVASLNQPGGYVTGTNLLLQAMEGKRLGLLRELVPNAALINVLLNPKNLAAADQLKDVQDAARVSGIPINVSNASTEQDIHFFFRTLSQSQGALLISADALFNARREQLVTLAAHYGIPAIYPQREAAVAGGLMSYGTSLVDGYRQVGIYAGRILRGEKPGDLPVVQPTRFELVINLKTAKTLCLTVPPSLLASADEVIE